MFQSCNEDSSKILGEGLIGSWREFSHCDDANAWRKILKKQIKTTNFIAI